MVPPFCHCVLSGYFQASQFTRCLLLLGPEIFWFGMGVSVCGHVKFLLKGCMNRERQVSIGYCHISVRFFITVKISYGLGLWFI